MVAKNVYMQYVKSSSHDEDVHNPKHNSSKSELTIHDNISMEFIVYEQSFHFRWNLDKPAGSETAEH